MTGAERPPHAVLLRSPDFKPSDVAGVLARRSGAHAMDVLPAVKRGWGLAAESLPAIEAEALASALTAAGQPALAAPTSLLESPPEPELVAKAELSGDGFDVVAGPEHLKPERLSWARLAVICAAGLETRSSRTVTEAGPTVTAEKAVRLGLTLATGIPLMKGSTETKRVIETKDRALLLDLVFVEPARRMRIEATRFDYSLLGAKMLHSAEVNFVALLGELTAHAPRALRGKGTRAMLARRIAAESLYDSLDHLNREERWLLSLVALRAAIQ
jgi:hypothetical protein